MLPRRFACVLGGLWLLAGASHCSSDARVVAQPIVVYAPRSCPVTQDGASALIHAGGDYDSTTGENPSVATSLDSVGAQLATLPANADALVVDVNQRSLGWQGVADVVKGGTTNVLVWRSPETCRLTRDVERRELMAFGVVDHHVIVTGGRALGGGQVPNTYVGDLTTGAIERLGFGLSTRRVNPTVTAFHVASDPPGLSSALVAGGEDPDSGIPIATAEVYVPKAGAASDVGDIDPTHIELAEARTEHGAVTLATGETLLVGGRGAGGILRTMEIIDPVSRRPRTQGVALLEAPRRKPDVIRLATGEILVSGGIDASGAPVGRLEWFTPDASRASKRSLDLASGAARSVVALDSGGALVVIKPPVPAPAAFSTVAILSSEGAFDFATSIDPASLGNLRLFPGAGGAPVLWTGSKWLRWVPWSNAFEDLPNAPGTGPALTSIANGDRGLALWLEDRGPGGLEVSGFRFAARTQYDAVPKALLVTAPEPLVPDRLTVTPDGARLRFDTALGLVMTANATAFLPDLTFADFDLDVDVSLGAATIVLRQASGAELEVGGATCAFAQSATKSISLERRGATVRVKVDGADARPCPNELPGAARIAIGLRGSQGVGSSGARNLRINRR